MPFLVTDLDPKFLAILEALEDTSTANGAAVDMDAQRRWFLPPLETWSGDPRDISGMNAAFDREDINQLYNDVVDDDQQRGRVGEAMVLKTQADYIAALERSFRTQHSSSVRAKIHAAQRRRGHGSSGGLYNTLDGNVVIWLRRTLSAAQYDPPE